MSQTTIPKYLLILPLVSLLAWPLFGLPANAASLSDASDLLSNETVSSAANHTVTFTTPNGIAEGETITLNFPSAFDTSTITEDDIDIAHDGVDLTTAATCAGSEQASVAIGSDVVTVTICAGDGGAILANSQVVVEIGTNALASGTGSNQIVNPTSAGTYTLLIDGTSTDSGTIAVPVIEPGEITIDATVSRGGGSSGADGSATSDTTAPVISDVTVSDTTDTSAVISWTTDEDARCTLDYGVGSTEQHSVSEASADTSHREELSALTSDSEVLFLITCVDGSGNSSEADGSFTTQTDVAPTNVSGLSCQGGDGQIAFDWVMPSDEDLSGLSMNCSTSAYPASLDEGTVVFTTGPTVESGVAGGLVSGTTYFCTAFTEDDGGNASSGAVTSCTTASEQTTSSEPGTTEPSTGEETTGEQAGEGTPPTTEETTTGAPETTSGTTAEENSETNQTSGGGTTGGSGGTNETTPLPPEVTGGTINTTAEVDVKFLSAGGSLPLANKETSVSVLPEEPFTILVTSNTANETIDSVYVVLDGQTYLISGATMQNGERGFFASLTAPKSGRYEVNLYVLFTDGTTKDLRYQIEAVDEGYVYEVVTGAKQPLAKALVTLWESVGGEWQVADIYSLGKQNNPEVSAEDGTYSWYVDNGVYRVEAVKTGYQKAQSSYFTVSNHIASVMLEMRRSVPPVATAASVASHTLEALTSLPEVQVAENIAMPLAVVVGVVSLSLLLSFFDLLPLLQYFLTTPILFLFKRKRQSFGVVYNAGTKLPIDLAIVRLYRADNQKLVTTSVTDKQGRFAFLVAPGQYRLVALKPGFAFPSQILAGVKDDGQHLDVYHGEVVNVTADSTITPNIPLDPEGGETKPNTLIVKRFLRALQQALGLVGLLLAATILILRPSWLTVIGFTFQAIVYLLTRRLTRVAKPKGWGVVYESGGRRPLGNTVVRIFEPKYNKLLETTLTDDRGRYTFLVGPSEYYTTYEKSGYQKREVRPIDTRGKKTSQVAVDVRLQKVEPPKKSL